MEKNSDEWEKWCLLEASEKAPMPGDWGKISDFRQLLIIRALKPGRITNALQVLACCLWHATVLQEPWRPFDPSMQRCCQLLLNLFLACRISVRRPWAAGMSIRMLSVRLWS